MLQNLSSAAVVIGVLRVKKRNKKKMKMSCAANCGAFSVNSLLAGGDFCCLLIMFANSLDPSGLMFCHPDPERIFRKS